MIPGKVVTIHGFRWTVPALNVKLLKKFQKDLDELTNPEAIAKLGVTGYAVKAMPVIVANLQRNYPELTEDRAMDEIPVPSVAKLVKAMFEGAEDEDAPRPLVVSESVPASP